MLESPDDVLNGCSVQAFGAAEDVDVSAEVYIAEWFEDYAAAGLRCCRVAGHERDGGTVRDNRGGDEELVDPMPDVDPMLEEIARQRNICLSNNIGISNTFVWADRNSDVTNYA